MTEHASATGANAADIEQKPPEIALHDGLALLLRHAERHHPPALRTLAELRRGGARFGGQGTASAELLRLVGPLGVPGERPEATNPAAMRFLDDATLVAWLVATTRPAVGFGHGGRSSFGADFRGVRPRFESNADKLMDLLVASTREDLERPLRRAATLLASTPNTKGNPIWLDVAGLVRDLGRWDDEKRPAQRRWALDFWAFVSSTDGPPAAAQPSTSGTGR